MFFTIIPLWYYMALLPGLFLFPSEVSNSPGPQMPIDPQNLPEMTYALTHSYCKGELAQCRSSLTVASLYPAVSGERQLYITLIYGCIQYISKAFDYLIRSQTFHL